MSAASRWSRAARAIRYLRCVVIYGASETGAKSNHLEQVRVLIKQGAEVNAPIGFNRMLRQGEIPSSTSRRATAWPGGGCAQRVQMDRLKLLLANGAKVHGGELTKAAFA
jgi:hypothetical protein